MTLIRPLAKPLRRPIRLVVLISGGGTTLVNLAETVRRGELAAEIPLVVSSRTACGGIEKSAQYGIPCEAITRKSHPTVEAFSDAIFQRCRDVAADLVLCGGFLALLRIPTDFQYRVMNIHPSLIPAFCGHGYYGHAVHEAVLQRGCKISGCTVHFVDDEFDHGPIILQRAVPVEDDDTPERLAARVFAEECRAYPEAVRLFAAGRLAISDAVVRVLPASDA
jgi:formyltetrahydrofolate-dependent phosphoribosylglycinamide formyltransferase